jgi:UMF1 family MFS transporter
MSGSPRWWPGGQAGTTVHLLGRQWQVPGVTVFSFVNSAALVLVALLAPLLGALADFSGPQAPLPGHRLAAGGPVPPGWISFFGAGDLLVVSLLFMLSNLGFAGGSVFYDAFLPEVSRPGTEGRSPGLGYAAGYLGGGLLLVLIFVLKTLWPGFDFRWSFALTSLWWLVFALPTFLWLPRREPRRAPRRRAGGLPEDRLPACGTQRAAHAAAAHPALVPAGLPGLRHGHRDRDPPDLDLRGGGAGHAAAAADPVLPGDPGHGPGGAMLFGWLADRFSNRRSLALALGVWVVVLVWAWFLGLVFSAPSGSSGCWASWRGWRWAAARACHAACSP